MLISKPIPCKARRRAWLPLLAVAPVTLAVTLGAAGCAPQAPVVARSPVPAPTVAHHQHLISPGFAVILKRTELYEADDLLAHLDAAEIKRGVVLSMAYTYGDERKKIADHALRAREENDWTSAQVMRSGGRLVGFCSAATTADYALAELERCLRLPGMRGIKLHFANSGLDLAKPQDVARAVEIFRTANRLRAPVVVHMRARSSEPYGRAHGEAFLTQVLPAAPDIVVQVAHFAGAGPGLPENADQALDPLAEAVARGDRRTRNVWFDVTTVATADTPADELERIARRIRQVGVRRVVFGSDLPISGNAAPAEAWTHFRRAPLTEAEFRTIAANVAPYMR